MNYCWKRRFKERICPNRLITKVWSIKWKLLRKWKKIDLIRCMLRCQLKTPITCKALTRPSREQRNTPPPTGGFVPYKQKYKSYSFDLSKADSIFDELLGNKVIQFNKKTCLSQAWRNQRQVILQMTQFFFSYYCQLCTIQRSDLGSDSRGQDPFG